MKGIRKNFAAPQAPAEPLKPTMVRDVLSSLNGSDLAVNRRDAALISLLFAAALRRSEICRLDYGRLATAMDICISPTRRLKSPYCAPKRGQNP